MSESPRVGVIGPGVMGGALVRGWIRSGVVAADRLTFYTTNDVRAEQLASETHAVRASTPEAAVESADVVILAVKPHVITQIASRLSAHLSERSLLVSIAAGVRLSQIEAALADGARVARVMPNTPALVGQAASAYCLGRNATPADGDLIVRVFSAVGRIVEVKSEDLIDAVVGVAGSASAYIYLIIEALADGGVRAGLSRAAARELAAQTTLGAAKMVLDTGRHPAELKDQVTTPGGSTIAGLEVLEKAGIRGILIEAVLAAQRRSSELGRPSQAPAS